MNVVVIEVANFMQTPVQGVLLFANPFGINMYPEYSLLRDYVGGQFEDGLAAVIERHAEKRLHYPETPSLQVATIKSPCKVEGFELPMIVYAIADDPGKLPSDAYHAGLREASRVKLRSLAIPLYAWGYPIDQGFMMLLRNLRSALSLHAQQVGNTLTEVIVAVDSAAAHEIVVTALSEVFYNVY